MLRGLDGWASSQEHALEESTGADVGRGVLSACGAGVRLCNGT